MTDYSNIAGVLFAGTVFAAMGITASLGGCSDREVGKELLPDLGLSEIKYDGFGWFDCGEADWFRSRYSAKNQQGKTIQLTICEGFYKGKTVRYR